MEHSLFYVIAYKKKRRYKLHFFTKSNQLKFTRMSTVVYELLECDFPTTGDCSWSSNKSLALHGNMQELWICMSSLEIWHA